MSGEQQLQVTGGITKALLAALDQIQSSVTAGLTNPDGSPSGTAVYMHLPYGYPIDPKMYANPWTPMGGDIYSRVQNSGGFAAAPPPAGAQASTPAASLPKTPDPALQQALSSAYNTARIVDNMLMVTDKGVARSWPDRTVSIAYFTALTGMQAEPVPPPPAETQARIDAAQKVLYTLDANGDFTGYTPLYIQYRHNEKALNDARSAYALAYNLAMTDPAAGQAFPIQSASLQTAVDEAYNDLRNMGGDRVQEAMATLQSIGGSAAAALIAKARKMYDDFNVGLLGAIAEKAAWSYIDPVSWWDHTNNDFGVVSISASSSAYQAGGASDAHSYSHSFYNNSASSTSAGAGFDCFFYSASANASVSEEHHRAAWDTQSSGHQAYHDQSSSASVSFDWFVASIERPWLLGDLFHMQGWYIKGGKKNCISDGTITGQIDAPDRLLPMIPKGFVVVRNVTITADDWGEAGAAFQQASASASSASDASSTSWGGSVGYFGIGGSVQHSESESSGAFSSAQDSSSGWSYTAAGKGGTLKLMGSQIVGWIGQIQPASPYRDDPGLSEPAAGQPQAAPAPAPVP